MSIAIYLLARISIKRFIFFLAETNVQIFRFYNLSSLKQDIYPKRWGAEKRPSVLGQNTFCPNVAFCQQYYLQVIF